jgi:hypothetical protein
MTNSAPSHIKHDTSRWPLCVASFVGDPSIEEHKRTLDWYASLLERGEPFMLICDNRGLIKRPPAAANDLIQQFVKENRERFADRCVGVSMVLDQNILIRMALQSLLMLARLPMPHRITDSAADAEHWGRKQLLAHKRSGA